MVRAPCCDKMGLKKGPWTQEEDQVLVSFIQRYGHGNWRALPKQAGLLRCGKSCRLRWMNYLRPDIKRGNFSKEEEKAIISLHGLLGNRWSAIAARLPGRTDNEIKNVWHTHLKKRAKPSPPTLEPKKKVRSSVPAAEMESKPMGLQLDPVAAAGYAVYEEHGLVPASPATSSSELSSAGTDSSATTGETNGASVKEEYRMEPSENPLDIDESFWSDALSLDNSATSVVLSGGGCHAVGTFHMEASPPHEDDHMDFWLSVFMGVGGLPSL